MTAFRPSRLLRVSGTRPAGEIALQSQGFTLVELVLATTIATLVIGILSVALNFSLRMWERQQDRQPSELPMILDLMALQLASFDATPLSPDVGAERPLFIGDEFSLALATDHSVKALSGGVPVVARYVFVPKEKTLYYAEMPMDPYHPEPLRDFLEMKPNSKDKKTWPHFYPVEVGSFSLEYAADEESNYKDSWDDEGEKIPQSVLARWTVEKESFSRVMALDVPFPLVTKTGTEPTATPGGS